MKRRDFLKKGGILATAATLPGIMTAKVERKENETLKKHEINIGGYFWGRGSIGMRCSSSRCT